MYTMAPRFHPGFSSHPQFIALYNIFPDVHVNSDHNITSGGQTELESLILKSHKSLLWKRFINDLFIKTKLYFKG